MRFVLVGNEYRCHQSLPHGSKEPKKNQIDCQDQKGFFGERKTLGVNEEEGPVIRL
jgi:hypothetical protein